MLKKKKERNSNGPKSTVDANTVIAGDLNIPLSPTDRSCKQRINKETSELLYTLDQIDMVDIYRIFHPTTRQYIFFSVAHGTFYKIDHILGYKANLNKFKKIKITSCIILDHNRIN
jgi:exonuclease III